MTLKSWYVICGNLLFIALLIAIFLQWNGIIAIRFVGPYILVFKTRSIEIYPLPSSLHPRDTEHPRLPVLKQSFPSTFRVASFSEIENGCTDAATVGGAYSNLFCLSVLAYDVLQGLFHYKICINIPHWTPAGASYVVPSLDVDLVGVFAMANNIPALLTLPSSAWQSPSVDDLPTPTPTPTPTHTFGGNAGRLGPNPSTRGFISTYSLGSQGRRAIWVERKRGSVVREIMVWSLGHKEKYRQEETAKEMSGSVVYTMASYDLGGWSLLLTFCSWLFDAETPLSRGPYALCVG